MPRSRYPSTRTLTSRLGRMVGTVGSMAGRVEVVDRTPELCGSTFPVEVVTCRVGDGAPLTLLCKYSRPERPHLPAWHLAHGHRHGVGYEARVYRHVLEPLAMTTPRLRGTYEGAGGRDWLAIDYLDGCMQIKSAPQTLENAATWIGRLHSRNEPRVSEPALGFVQTYTADYYRGWARRTLAYARRFRRNCRRIELVCEAFEEGIEALLGAPLTVIHGEYYPANVLLRAGNVHPVDWESSAVAAGEIDLAALTEDWSAEDAERCERAYVRVRWPVRGADPGFAPRLSAARLYLLLRWAGVREAWSTRESRRHHLRRLAGEWMRLHVRRAVELAP